MANQIVLSVDDFSLGYRNRDGAMIHVLRHISLAVEAGASIGLVGESGCGKSTLALAMMGFLRQGSEVLSGDIDYHDQPLFELPERKLTALRGRHIGLIPQNAGQSLTPTLTIAAQLYEAIQLHTELPRKQWHQQAIALLEQVRLPAPEAMMQRYPHQLSGGQQQRVAIAMALAGNPDVLILDEPTTGLDVTTQAHILELLRQLRTRLNTTMVFVSHDLGAVARISDHIAVMYAGEVVEYGRCEQVLRHPCHPYTRGLLASIPRLSQPGLPPSLPGYPPKVGSITQGCAFAPRCNHRIAPCETHNAPLQENVNHQLRCHLHTDQLNHATVEAPLHYPVQSSDDPLLTLEQLQLRYQAPSYLNQLLRKPLPPATVDGIELQLNRGQTLALVGESGSGKSTIMKAISGILPPHKGAMALQETDLNQPLNQRDPRLKQRIQMIFQNPDASLNPRHTIAEILQLPLQLYYGLSTDACRQKAEELLALVRLGTHYLDRLPSQLSGGEKQRVAIARCFAGEPELILCDEVTSALDVSVQAAVLRLLKELQQEKGVTYLFIAHDLAVVKALADQVAVLYQGRLCQVGSVDALFNGVQHPYTRTLLDAVLEPDPDHHPRLRSDDAPEQHPPHQGCAYQRRCHHATTQCRDEQPPWQQQEGNRIRCHRPIETLPIANAVAIQPTTQSVEPVAIAS